MASKKCDYEIIFGEPQKKYDNSYKYTRYNTEVVFYVSEKGSKIFFNRKKDSIEKFQTGTFFKEPIRRLYLINTLRYSKILSHQLCTVKIDNKEYQNIKNPITTIFPTENLSSVPSALANDKMITDLIEHFTLDNTKMTVLNNYLLALGYQNSPSEQFMHFWMAFNGLYGKLKRTIVHIKNDKDDKIKKIKISEAEELENWGICFDLEYNSKYFDSSYSRTQHKIFSSQILNVIVNSEYYSSITSLSSLNESKLKNEIIKEINEKYEIEINDCFSYLLLKAAYFTRCDLFHGDKKINLFATNVYNRDKVFNFLNCILKEYLADMFLLCYETSVLHDNAEEKIDNFKMQIEKKK